MSTTTHTQADPFTTAVKAAYKAINVTRAHGIYDNTMVHHAVATCGITQEEAAEFGAEAVRMAFEIRQENAEVS